MKTNDQIFRIGILSDTHGLLRPEVKEIIQDCDAILHAGDIDRHSVLDELGEYAPVYAVRGNADKGWAEYLPITLTVNLGGKTFFLVHNRKDVSEDIRNADYVVFGHSHKYEEKMVDGRMWLNPGSCGKRRFSQPITLMVMEIAADGEVTVSRKDILGEKPVEVSDGNIDMANLVRGVIREMDRGVPVAQIAEKCHVDAALAEQICRMYATHPGIDVDGILNRIIK